MENFHLQEEAEWFENAEEIDREYALFRSLRSYYQSKRNEVSRKAAKLFLVLLKLRKSYDL